MIELLRNLYRISGKESSRITKMLLFEVLKSFFEGVALGATMLLLLKLFENLFERRPIATRDVIEVFLVALLSAVGKIVCGYLADRNKYIASYTMGAENRLQIGDQLKQVSMGFFNANRLGEISSGLTTIIGDLETIGVVIIEMMFVGVIQTVMMALFMVPFDWITGGIILITLALALISNALFQNKADRSTKRLQSLKIHLNADTLEYVKGIGVVKSFGKGKEMLSELSRSISESRKGFLDVEKNVLPAAFSQLTIFRLGSCAIILTAILRYCAGEIAPTKAVMLLVSSFIVFAGFEMAGSMQNLKGIAVQNLEAITRLRNLPVIPEGTTNAMRDAKIEIKDVDFSYEEKPLFRNMSLSIPANRTMAIVGSSGSGKTTLCSLIARFWDVDRGEIRIGGVDVRDYRYDELLSNFTFVFQDVYLFDDTVRNNIKFGKPDATDEEVVAVAKEARCHEFIMELPDGYDTVLQEGGSDLSGGERQRISIARAMLKPSQIVILDEATSSVDPENEEQLILALRKLLADKTVLIIAHKLETIRGADQILVMDSGSIESVGTHEELLEKSDTYRRFIEQREAALRWKLGNTGTR